MDEKTRMEVKTSINFVLILLCLGMFAAGFVARDLLSGGAYFYAILRYIASH
jgi:energy-converting hydrogenase Eha subunit G